MSSVDGWKTRLEVLENAYSEAVSKIITHIDSLSPDELRQFRDDLKRPTDTNCSWQLWEGKEIALMFVNGVDDRKRMSFRATT